jgi:tRNA A-37 threonylcarbamoyl transferase component Bud32
MECTSCHTPVDASQRFCPACGAALSPAETAQQDPLLGATLGGKYKVVRLVGEGGMGAVYEGEQLLGTTKRKVAVKTLHPHLSRDPKIKARFEREVGTVAELEHPNTIQVYDFGTYDDGILYIVMEFLQGKSLATVLETEGALAPDRVERIMQQICGSLEEAHGRGIVHRDLKPDNIVLVDRAGKKDFVKVLDFGIAKRSNESDTREQKLTQQGTVLGTPPYMSPEQFSGRPIDARSDIYSLGVMAYEMLTGKLPFAANTPWEWATQHMTQAPIPLESHAAAMRAPASMRSAIVRALAKAPEDRFQTVKDFIDAFVAPSAPEKAPARQAGGGDLVRQKTEVGAPLDIAAAFGASAASAPAGRAGMAGMGAGGTAGPAYGPSDANMAVPAPATIPQPPPRGDGQRRGGRTVLLVAAAVIAAASVGAIVFAMRGNSSEGKAVVFDPGSASTPAAPAASLQAATTPIDSTPSAPSGGSDVPPLAGAGGAHNPPRPAPPHPVASSSGTSPTPPSSHGPAASTVVPAPAAAKYDGPECQTARRLRALGHPREAESWVAACTAKGGAP